MNSGGISVSERMFLQLCVQHQGVLLIDVNRFPGITRRGLGESCRDRGHRYICLEGHDIEWVPQLNSELPVSSLSKLNVKI